jgi:hypothetical protein
MILSAVLILLLLGIAYFHYTQGLFPATTSAFAAGIAALTSFGLHESVARSFGTNLGAYADGVALIALFAAIYLILRVVIDSGFPGNVRYPVVLDKVGAGVMGVVAGFFAVAIVALAGHQLPFGPTYMMYARYETDDMEVGAPRNLARLYGVNPRDSGSDMMTYADAIEADQLGDPSDTVSLWVPFDAWFVSMASALSSPEGSISGPVDFAEVYPGGYDGYADALYARRLGIQAGGRKVALATEEAQEVRLGDAGALFLLSTGEGGQFPEGLTRLRHDKSTGRDSGRGTALPDDGKAFLLLRLLFDNDAAEDQLVRFGPANARLVLDGEQYFAVGTLESTKYLMYTRPDDYIFATTGVDLVFEIDASLLEGDPPTLPEAAFLEFKELARIPLGDERVWRFATADARTQVERKALNRRWIAAAEAGVPVSDTVGFDRFFDLRDALPAEPADPAQAERLFLQGNAPTVDVPDVTGDADATTAEPQLDPDPDADEDEDGGMLDRLRGESDRRNELLEGGD